MLAPALERAREVALNAGRELDFVASVTGTEADPQGRSAQEATLRAAGVLVAPSNAAAARLAAEIVGAGAATADSGLAVGAAGAVARGE